MLVSIYFLYHVNVIFGGADNVNYRESTHSSGLQSPNMTEIEIDYPTYYSFKPFHIEQMALPPFVFKTTSFLLLSLCFVLHLYLLVCIV